MRQWPGSSLIERHVTCFGNNLFWTNAFLLYISAPFRNKLMDNNAFENFFHIMCVILFWFLCFSTFCSVIWRRVIHKWWDNSKVADEFLPAPANITIAKGFVYMAATWDFVNFTINSDVSKTLLDWVKYTKTRKKHILWHWIWTR